MKNIIAPFLPYNNGKGGDFLRLPALPKRQEKKERRPSFSKWREKIMKRWFAKKPFYKVPPRKK